MLTGGQVNSVSAAACVADGGCASPTACEFDPKIWLKRDPNDEPPDDDEPNMLPPPQPDNMTAATVHTTAPRQCRGAPFFKSLLSTIVPVSECRAGYNRPMAANERRNRAR
jgi:hypothetical protein